MYVLVAGFAKLMWNRRFEVGSAMALRAAHIEVFPDQWVFRLRMIEGLLNVAQRLPACVVVARTAVCAQRAFMRVLMTVLTPGERNAGVANARFGPIRGGFFFVALRAGSGAVRAGQGELRCGVVKTRDILPLRKRVALSAVCARLAVVFVLVAGLAIALQPEISAMEVANANALPGILRDVLGGVTPLALQLCVSAFQRITRLSMIEVVHVHVPQNRNEVPAVVLRVALDAGIVAVAPGHQGRMQPPLLSKPLGDLHMACRAAKHASTSSTDVTARAVSRTIEFSMRFGHGSR